MSVVNERKWTCDLCKASTANDVMPTGWLELEYKCFEVVNQRNYRHICACCRLRIAEGAKARSSSEPEVEPVPVPASPSAMFNERTIAMYKGIIQQVLESLPSKRDWLDPDLEREMKDLVSISEVKPRDQF